MQQRSRKVREIRTVAVASSRSLRFSIVVAYLVYSKSDQQHRDKVYDTGTDCIYWLLSCLAMFETLNGIRSTSFAQFCQTNDD